MTDDLQIDRALALAIGWREELLKIASGELYVAPENEWYRRFSHKDPAVIWCIAERFGCFPRLLCGLWAAGYGKRYAESDNPATAVALAVIAAHGKAMP